MDLQQYQDLPQLLSGAQTDVYIQLEPVLL